MNRELNYREQLDEYYSARWAAHDSRNIYSPSKLRRVQIIRESVEACVFSNKSSSPSRVIDYGCGSGLYLPLLQSLGFDEVHAYDVTPTVIKRLGEEFPSIKTWTGDTNFPSILPDQYFDLILSIEVLEHIPDASKNQYFADLYRIAKRGGTVILTSPNGSLKERALSPSEAQPIEDWITLHRLKSNAKKAGFELLRSGSKGLKRYDGLNRLLLSSRLKILLQRINVWNAYIGGLEKLGRGITLFAVLRKP